MTKVYLPLPLKPIAPNHAQPARLELCEFSSRLQVGQEIEIRNSPISCIFVARVTDCYEDYALVETPQAIIDEAIERFMELYPGQYRLLYPGEFY